MFIDYNNVKNLVIEELINNNRLSFEILIANLKKFNLLDIVINNIDVKLKNNDCLHNVSLFGKNLGDLYIKYNRAVTKYNILQQFICENLQNYYLLMDNLLDYNSNNLLNEKNNFSKFNMRLYLREIIDLKEEHLTYLRIKKEVYYLQTMIGVFEENEDCTLENLTDFTDLSKTINRTINVENIKVLEAIADKIKFDNNRYKSALRRENYGLCKVKRI